VQGQTGGRRLHDRRLNRLIRYPIREGSARIVHHARMASWRDSLSEEAQADVDRTLNEALPFAQQMLERHGEFFPYAVKLTVGGDFEMVGATTEDEHPASADVLSKLYEGLTWERQTLRAAAIVADVRTGSSPSDAIRVEIEHREGIALAVLLTYTKKRLGRGVTFGTTDAAPGKRHIWPT
jgi:hypothetical protein